MNNFVPEQKIIEFFEQAYPLGKASDITLVRQSQNDVYHVRTVGGQYAVKVYLAGRADIKNADTILQQHRFAEALRSAGVRAEHAQRSRDDSTVTMLEHESEDRFVCVYDWVDGEPISPKITESQAREIGAVVGIIHNVGDELFPLQGREFMDVVRLVQTPFATIEPALREIKDYDPQPIVSAIQEVGSELKGVSDSLLCSCVVHGDMNPSNFLLNDDGFTLLDFDNCCNACPLWDLTVLKACFPGAGFDCMLNAYDDERKNGYEYHDLWALYSKAMAIWKFAYILELSAIKQRGVLYERGLTLAQVRQQTILSWTKYVSKTLGIDNTVPDQQN